MKLFFLGLYKSALRNLDPPLELPHKKMIVSTINQKAVQQARYELENLARKPTRTAEES